MQVLYYRGEIPYRSKACKSSSSRGKRRTGNRYVLFSYIISFFEMKRRTYEGESVIAIFGFDASDTQ